MKMNNLNYDICARLLQVSITVLLIMSDSVSANCRAGCYCDGTGTAVGEYCTEECL